MTPVQANPELLRETARFRKIWISLIAINLNVPPKLRPPSAWEGGEACQEISKTDYLWAILPTLEFGDSLFGPLMDKLSREAYLYKQFQEKIVPTNQGFALAIKTLSVALSKLKKLEAREPVVVAGLAYELKRYSTVTEETLDRTKKKRESLRNDGLLASPDERKTWSIIFGDDHVVHPIPPVDLIESERKFQDAKYPRNLLKRIELDRRFQIRVATILRSVLPRDIAVPDTHKPALGRDFLDHVSLRTIARLTVLTYLAGNLGQDANDRIILKGRKMPVTVTTVDGKLRAAGMK